MGKNDKWQENYWIQGDTIVEGVSLIFKNKRDRDKAMKLIQAVTFQNKKPYQEAER